ncbi:MAG: hypothetical protein U5L96_05070 [Owenweeksia sp.]|nr:hypothetical protein [Owenweeksia sp.]
MLKLKYPAGSDLLGSVEIDGKGGYGAISAPLLKQHELFGFFINAYHYFIYLFRGD